MAEIEEREVVSDEQVVADQTQEASEQASPAKPKKKRKKRKARKDASELCLAGRKDLLKSIDDIAPDMNKTVKLRVLGRYLESTKGLSDDDLTSVLKKDAKKIAARKRVEGLLATVHPEESVRNLKKIILFGVLLQEETHSLPETKLEQKVIEFEKKILAMAKATDLFDRKAHDPIRWHQFTTYRVAMDAAWKNENQVSNDEALLLRVLRSHLNISLIDHWIIGASLKYFPKAKALLHTPDEVHEARKQLQRESLLWSYRDQSNQNIDIVPSEIVEVLRDIRGLELQRTNFHRLMHHDSITVAELRKILKDRDMDSGGNKDDLITRVVEGDLRPSTVLDDLGIEKLNIMCRQLGQKSSGRKAELIQRLIEFYDDLSFEERVTQDPREEWYNNYESLAARSYSDLRAKKLISKDLDVEHQFEKATDFLFEVILGANLDKSRKVTKADGRILLEDRKVMLFDCKSVEKDVNLQDHLEDQFVKYLLKEREKGNQPLCFLVIGPSFTPQSLKLAHKYKAQSNWDIALCTASGLKHLAELWQDTEGDKPFPMGLFNRTDLIDREKAEFLVSLA